MFKIISNAYTYPRPPPLAPHCLTRCPTGCEGVVHDAWIAWWWWWCGRGGLNVRGAGGRMGWQKGGWVGGRGGGWARGGWVGGWVGKGGGVGGWVGGGVE